MERDREYKNEPGFGALLRFFREHSPADQYRRVTQQQLAERIDRDNTTISRWENEERVPTVDDIDRLAQALGLTRQQQDQVLAAAGHMASPSYDVTKVREIMEEIRLLLQSLPREVQSSSSAPTDQDHSESNVAEQPFPTPCPYRGLSPFREADAPYFFGREQFTLGLLNAVRKQALVVVLGSSGSGKSSVIQAGLLPRAREEGNWQIVSFRPSVRPLHSLATALLPILEPELSTTARLIEANRLEQGLLQAQISLSEVIERLMQVAPSTERILLAVDQFEEIYTLCPDPQMQRCFLDALLEAVDSQRGLQEPVLSLVMTLRADFLGEALAYRPFSDALQDATLNLGPMNREELARAITAPAAKVNIDFESGLVERILDDVGTEPGNLPLLEFSLTQIWHQQLRGIISHQAYEESGRVANSLARHAESVFEQLNGEQKRLCRHVLLQLVHPGEGRADTCRIATHAELGEENWQMVRRLADARLAITDRTSDGQEVAELAHEALILSWDRMRRWVDTDRSFRLWQERLRIAVRQWQGSDDQDEGLLLRGGPLVEAESWLADRAESLTRAEVQYIQVSKEQQERVQRNREWARRLWLLGGSGVTLVVVSLALLAFWMGERNQLQADATAQERSRVLANHANIELADGGGGVPLALLLSIEAFEWADTAEARGSLLRALGRYSNLITFLWGPEGAGGEQRILTFSPDGAAVAAEVEGGIMVWNLEDYMPLWDEPLRDPLGKVDALAFSPDGETIAAGYWDGRILLWDLATREPVAGPLISTGPVFALEFSPGAEYLASGGSEGVMIWDLGPMTGSYLNGHESSVWALAFSPEENILASGDWEGTVYLWDLESRQSIGEPLHHDGWVLSLAFSPISGLQLATAGEFGIMVWDLTSRQGRPLGGLQGWVLELAFKADGQRLVSGGEDGIIDWHLDTGQDQIFLVREGWTETLGLSPDGRMLVLPRDGGIALWALDGLPPIGHFIRGYEGKVENMAFSKDNAGLFLWGEGVLSKLYPELSDDQVEVIEPLIEEDNIEFLSIDPYSQRALLLMDNVISVFNMETRQSETPLQIDFQGPLRAAALSTDNQDNPYVAVADDKGITLWAQSTGDSTLLQGEYGWVTVLAFGPEGKTLAAGSSRGVTVWDLNSYQSSSLQGDLGWVESLVFSPDGDYLVAGDSLGAVYWHLKENQVGTFEGERLQGHNVRVDSLAIDPNTRLMVSGGEDGTIQLWGLPEDLPSMRPHTLGEPLHLHRDSVTALAFSTDGKNFASTGGDRIAILSTQPESWKEHACRTANRDFTEQEWRSYQPDVDFQGSKRTCDRIVLQE